MSVVTAACRVSCRMDLPAFGGNARNCWNHVASKCNMKTAAKRGGRSVKLNDFNWLGDLDSNQD
jgi:hypothetical protein